MSNEHQIGRWMPGIQRKAGRPGQLQQRPSPAEANFSGSPTPGAKPNSLARGLSSGLASSFDAPARIGFVRVISRNSHPGQRSWIDEHDRTACWQRVDQCRSY